MSFPTDVLPQKTELFVDGAWLDLTGMGRIRNDADVVITRGRANEQASLSPATCGATINNRDGLFSNRNPNSIYFGKLRRNIPFRHSITESTPWLRLPQWLQSADDLSSTIDVREAGSVSTTDKAVLDITGDIDVRVEIEPDDWRIGNTYGRILAAKYDNISGAQRSWVLFINGFNQLSLRWSTNGTTTLTVSSDQIDNSIARQAWRVTLDVNNGAAGYDVRFYTADSINDTWTQWGSTQTGSGTTSIFSSTSDLVVGKQTVNLTNGFSDTWPFTGRIWGFQLYNGIGGTLVATMDPTSRTPGDTSWSDGLGTPNTWTVNLTAEITDSDYRFYGELAQLPQKWDSTGTDVYVPVTAAGITRRLTQGPQSLNGALRRYLESIPNSGYWTGEDSSQATSLANVTPGGRAGTLTDATLGPVSDFPASTGAVRINSSATRLRGVCAPATAGSDAWFQFYFKLDAVPAVTVDVAEFYTSGSARRITLQISGAGTGFLTTVYDADGTSLGTANTTFGGSSITDWLCFMYRVVDTGAGFDVVALWRNLGLTTTTHSHSVSVGSGTVGVSREWRVGGDADLADAEFAHFQTGNSTFSMLTFKQAKAEGAAVSEPAAVRWLRVLGELGIDGWCIGDPLVSEPMGPQPADTLPNILAECAEVERGIMFEPRDRLGYVFRTRGALYQQSGPAIDYAAGELSGVLEPVDDDQLTRNDVTVRRPGGSEARSEKTSGPNNVNDPASDPDGVGRYDVSLNKNAETDARLPNLAQYETYLGTWDELRYPTVQVELARPVFLTVAGLEKAADLARLDVGDRFDLTGLPAWLPPDDVALMVQGYTETHRNRNREFRWNTSPYGPYLYASHLMPTDTSLYKRAAAVDSWLNAAVDDNDLTMVVRTDSGPRWGTTVGKPQNFPLPIEMGGETMTVDGIADALADAFGRTSVSSLGSADTGGAYTTSGGAAGNYAVNGGLGRITNASTGVNRIGWLPSVASDTFDLYLTTSVSAVATGQSILNFLIARLADSSNYLRAEVTFNTGSTVDIRIRKVVAGVDTSLVLTSAVVAYSAGTLVTCHFQGFGSQLRAKIYLASASEPDYWHARITDSSILTAGFCGFGAVANAGNTNVNPESRFDTLALVNPQLFTLDSRSDNSVVKSHDPESPVQVVNRVYAQP